MNPWPPSTTNATAPPDKERLLGIVEIQLAGIESQVESLRQALDTLLEAFGLSKDE